jgi:hypothetical protein
VQYSFKVVSSIADFLAGFLYDGDGAVPINLRVFFVDVL